MITAPKTLTFDLNTQNLLTSVTGEVLTIFKAGQNVFPGQGAVHALPQPSPWV